MNKLGQKEAMDKSNSEAAKMDEKVDELAAQASLVVFVVAFAFV